MLLFSDQIYEKIVNDFILKLLIGKKYHLHGTFASKRSKYMTDIDITNYYHVTDDPICDKCKKKIQDTIVKKITSLPPNTYFESMLAGFDDRFLVKWKFNKDGKITQFDQEEFKSRMEQLAKKKVITKEQLKKINSYLKSNSKNNSNSKTLDLLLLREYLIKFAQLEWSKEEIIKGEKKHMGRLFKLTDMMTGIFNDEERSNPFLMKYVVMYDKMSYVGLDLSLIFYCTNKNSNNISSIEHVAEDKFIPQIKLINDLHRVSDNLWVYEGLFKNLAQDKYLKAFKRLRTLLTKMIYNNYNNKVTDYQNVKKIKKLRYDMLNELNSKDYNKYNQIKNRIEIIMFLRDHISEVEIKGLIIKIIEDLWEYIEFNHDRSDLKNLFNELKSSKSDMEKIYEQLEELKRKIVERINNGAKKLFYTYYKQAEPFLKFRV